FLLTSQTFRRVATCLARALARVGAMCVMNSASDVEIVPLVEDEEPDGPAPHIIVLHALSGEYRVVVMNARGLDHIEPSPASGAHGASSRDAALAVARGLAAAHGAPRIYLRENM
ncbi:MAG: hypothetical protein JWN07_2291, partial [Hyphomicrobiales bacterium]|nr:hypothetical protein [Hyphomicrobiales bacterium]